MSQGRESTGQARRRSSRAFNTIRARATDNGGVLSAQPPGWTFEIVAGESIGPFKIGMPRAAVREAARSRLGIDVPGGDLDSATSDEIGSTGIVVSYDPRGRCREVWARFGMAYRNPSTFTLFGQDITRMTDAAVVELCRDHWADVMETYVGIDVSTAGFSATYFDNRSDGAFCAATIRPPRE